ncbi:MAG: hypothetical protein HQL96_05480 [Magnetococcales bacterium]|nr:hypothetical protein [Magnetococcales bacterium]
MKIKQSLQIVAAAALIAGFGVSSVWAAASQTPTGQSQTGGAVQIQGNTNLDTNVQGGVKQEVKGSNNKATTNVGGVQGTVQVKGNTKSSTNVKGGVTNQVSGSNNDSQLSVGGIQGK